MWSSRPLRLLSAVCGMTALATLAACTVEPLNASRPDSQLSSEKTSGSTREILASTTVDPVDTRAAQQVRNNLLFAMNGGRLQPGGTYSVQLTVVSRTSNLSITTDSLTPTSARVSILVDYKLVEVSSGKTVASGRRRSIAGYDRTTQSFANERAERNAQNRAAKEVAQQVRLSIAQNVAGL